MAQNSNHSAAVLRNKGVCVVVNETIQDEAGNWEVARGAASDPKTTKVWVRFDGNALADLEEAWGDLEKYQGAMGTNPHRTVRRTFAIVLGWDDLHDPLDTSGKLCAGCRRAGLAMVDGAMNAYTNAISAAIALANGLDPTQVVRLVEQGERTAKAAVASRDAVLAERLAAVEAENPGASTSTDGSTNGSVPAAATTSSGD